MTNPTFLKIVAAIGIVAGSLVTAGVLPAWAAVIATAVGTAAGAFHPQVTK